MRKVNIGIVGSGAFAHIHAQAIRSLKNASLVAVFSRSSQRAEEFADRCKIKDYSDLDKFLKDPQIDIVDIVTVHSLHAEIGIKAALAGKDLIIEKPLATNLEEADNLINTCKETGRRLSVISQHRYDPAYREAKCILESQSLGKIIFSSILMRWHRPESYFHGRGEWRGNLKYTGGGVLMMQAIHLIDILIWLLGPVKAVIGYIDTKTHRIEVEDTALALLEFENKSQGMIMATTSAPCNITDRLEIHGHNGSLIIEDHQFLQYIRPSRSRLEEYLRKIKFRIGKSLPLNITIKKRLPCATVGTQIEEVVHSIIYDLPVPNPPEEARHLLNVILAIYESAGNNQKKIIIK